MEQFYLKNVDKYHSLLAKLESTPKPRVSDGQHGPNMVVAARVRPVLQGDGFPTAVFPRSSQKNVADIHDLYNHPSGIPCLKSFNYQVDRLFGSESTTEEIYEDLAADLVQFAWDGGIATLFAYGQTGSGKTFTISRLEELVAETLMNGSMKGEREIHMTMIDLAGNSAFDLLTERAPISLLEDSSGVTRMLGAAEIQVHNTTEMMDLIERAASFRRTASTLKNNASSRSHAICRIRIHSPPTATDGTLYLIDLAGSEDARDTALHGADRMRETRDINISLSALKDCIRGKALVDSRHSGQGIPHIPFRRSALTRVLKHALDPEGTQPCKTAVLACVNPSLADVAPSKNTLRFAEMLRVLDTRHELQDSSPMNWPNHRVRLWIARNSAKPRIMPEVLAPRETGAQLFNLSDTEFNYRCRKCPGVRAEHAKALRLKFWQLFVES
ncbi:P-loop containing nucleoside triphosphate hydrolase protein [Ampelomyces quisqualis]|uniref:Kinesin-like protein n=1 Tax=Ampelomyces quisqualis TaxID=50730 RepID=A0A6A5QM05_AMPQU|nr:P-loop containing nucleoside triphosphate hydrolase protein [Ampelomyces quisqualis]